MNRFTVSRLLTRQLLLLISNDSDLEKECASTPPSPFSWFEFKPSLEILDPIGRPNRLASLVPLRR
ncbi:MAG: hypothetical protein EBV06_12480 [Planctomycetia bacterium]|nr:hypothetical protein [Planctomycetia bacterium]